MPSKPSKFLSEEDLDLQSLSQQELYSWWDWWLEEAQASNEFDADSYSHGVFQLMREPRKPGQAANAPLNGVKPRTM